MTLGRAEAIAPQALLLHPQPTLLVEASTGRIVDANEGALRLYGFDRAQLLELGLPGLWSASEGVPELATALVDGATRSTRHRGADGEPRHVMLRVRDLSGVSPGHVLVTVQDMRPLVLAEDRARRAERLASVIVEQALGGIALLGPDLTNRTLRSSALDLGFRTLEVGARDRRSAVHPADRTRFEEAAASLAGRPGARVPITYRLRDERGRWGWFEGTLTNLLDDPDIGAFVLNAHDVTDNVRAAESVKHLNDQLERRMQHLQALRRIDMAITNAVDVALVLDIFLEQVQADLKVEAAGVLLLDEHAHVLQPTTARGFEIEVDRDRLVPLGEGLAGFAAHEERTVYVQDLQSDARWGSVVPPEAQAGFVAYWAVPMLTKGQLQGVIELYARTAFVPDGEWFEFLEAFADQGAIAVESALLMRSLERSNVELQLAYDRTIEGWAYALDLKDEETAGHSQRVTQMTVRLAQRVGVAGTDLVHIQRGALLHDIGKMGVPDSILLKKGPLNPAERSLIEQHPVYAFDLLSPIDFLQPAIDIPYAHHERWDGTGYPRGLAGEEIPLAARIFAIVDVFDALTSERPYRPAWERERTLDYIREQSGSHFDPELVDAFMAMLDADPTLGQRPSERPGERPGDHAPERSYEPS